MVGDREEALSGTDELAVRFEDVSYAYPGAAGYALRNLSFEAAPGMMTAIAGEIGSGKSTAIALVPRLVDPTAGRIVIGGRDARGWVPGDLRRRIGYVSQEAVLFSTTIGENIRLGRSLLPEEAMNAAIDAAGLREEIGRWPRGLETRVGSRGLRLSGGQKQRVALARALAGRPSILLLDDCTASLDAAKEDEIWQAILALLPTCTTIVVTHRPATLEKAHRIVVLGQGRPVEIGSFDDLNRAGTRFHGLYARWRLTGQAE